MNALSNIDSDYNLSAVLICFFVFSELALGSVSDSLLFFFPSYISIANIILALLVAIVVIESKADTGLLPFRHVYIFHIFYGLIVLLAFVDGFIERNSYSQQQFVSGMLSILAMLCLFEVINSQHRLTILCRTLVLASAVSSFLSILISLPLGLENYIPHTSTGQSELSGGALGIGANRQATFSTGPDITSMLALASAVICICCRWLFPLSKKYLILRASLVCLFLAYIVVGQSRGAYVNLLAIMYFGSWFFLLHKSTQLGFPFPRTVTSVFMLFVTLALLLVLAGALANTSMDRELARNFLERAYYGMVAYESLMSSPISGESNAILAGGHPHNAFFQMAISQGFPPLVLVCLLFCWYLNLIIRGNLSPSMFSCCCLLLAIVFIQNNFYMGFYQKTTMFILALPLIINIVESRCKSI